MKVWRPRGPWQGGGAREDLISLVEDPRAQAGADDRFGWRSSDCEIVGAVVAEHRRSKDSPARERVRVELRSRTDDDLDACELLAREVHDVDGYPPRFADDLRRFVSASGALAAWVAVSDGAIVGHVALQPTGSPAVMALAGEVTGREPGGLGVVARLLVAPAHRRKGLGGTLLGVAAQAAHARGRWPVLDVATLFDAAIRLYERSGWVCAGRVDVHFRDAEPLAEYVYIGPTPGHGRLSS